MGPCHDKNIIGHLEGVCNDFHPAHVYSKVLPSLSSYLSLVSSCSAQAAIALLALRSGNPEESFQGEAQSYFKKSLRDGAAESKLPSVKSVSDVWI